MRIFEEQRLWFEFGAAWQVEKYDEHAAYREGIERVKEQIPCKHCQKPREVGTKAVDFVGTYKGESYLIEVKDLRGHGVENRRRLRDDLAVEVALKVRDTLAGLVGTLHGRGTSTWQPLVSPIFRQAPKVLLWLEEDAPTGDRARGRPDPTLDIRTALSQRLSWLSPRVMVVSRKERWSDLDLRVKSLPDRVYKLRTVMKEKNVVSRDDFCRAWPATPQVAGRELARLCEKGIFVRAPGDGESFTRGAAWDQFHEEPA